jgi:hypothetical protein
MKTQLGMEIYLQVFLTSALDRGSQAHVPAALAPEKSPWYTLDRRLGGPQNRSGRGGKEKNLMIDPARNWTPVVQPVA